MRILRNVVGIGIAGVNDDSVAVRQPGIVPARWGCVQTCPLLGKENHPDALTWQIRGGGHGMLRLEVNPTENKN